MARATKTKTAKRNGGGTTWCHPGVALEEEAMELPEGTWERIARKAYELYEQRGRQEGYALQDWLDAETIVMEEIHESRE